MTDRQPTKPGRIALTDEQTNVTKYYTMEMADEPTDEGTPPIKVNLFSDATAAKYPAGTETVDDALGAVPGMIASIGDIKTTVRTDLGDKWLLCNGDVVDPTQYPELCAELTKVGIVNPWLLETSIIPYKWKQVGNYWVRIDSNSFYYASNPTQIGTQVTPYTIETRTIEDIVYTGTYYAVLLRSSSSTYWNLCYSTSISGPWSNFDLPYESGYTSSCSNLLVDNAGLLIFVHCNNRNDLATLYHGTNPASLSTSTSTTTPKGAGHLAYGNGYYVWSNTNSSSTYRGIRYTTDVTTSFSNWTKITSQYGILNFVNGYFASGDGSLYGTSPTNLSGINDTTVSPVPIQYLNGYYFRFRQSGSDLALYYTEQLGTTWKNATIGPLGSVGGTEEYGFIYGDKACIKVQNGIFYSNVPSYYLPAISSLGENVQGTYTYIKAKE